MRALSPQLQASLDSGATNHARCWRVTRSDGVVLGFTDHDRMLSFDGVDYEPDTGLTPSTIEAGTGLSADSHAVEGALNSARITADDIARGLYTGAEVALFQVDWRDVDARVLLSRGQIGEITWGNTAFEAEVLGLSDTLSQPMGRAFMHSCACRLGEEKCAIDLTDSAYRGAGTVSVADPLRLEVAGLDAFDDGWFSGGNLTWTSGANAGVEGHVKAHLRQGAEAIIELWLAPPMAVQQGDGFEITAGCDKTATTCHERFGNLENFRGFPHMPGDDVVASYPQTGGSHDGGSLFRS